jgi:cobalt-zinc-cadmium efflux system membrane fusion protein
MSILNNYLERKRFVLIGVVIVVFMLGIGLGTRLLTSLGHAAAQDTIQLALIHQGDKFIIPEGSALRSRLVVQQVAVKNTPHTLQLPASVEADPARTVNIMSPVTGRVFNLRVRLGDHVVKGQPLAVIESGDLAQAYADDDKARDALHHTERTLERVRSLREAGADSLKDLEQSESDYAQAKAEFNRAEARLKEIGIPSQPKGGSRLLTLTAPTTGSVTTLTTAPGAFVNDLTASLMTVANLDSVWVTANVPEIDIADIVKGQAVDVSFAAYPGKVFHGTVAFLSNVVEPDTHRIKVRIAFSNPSTKFKPNMFATASFNIPQKSALFVPNSALLMDNDGTVVFVEVAPWTFIKRPVLPGYGEGDGARIDQGLNPGDRIIVKGVVLLND